ncbi:MAG: MATE family efflux transporter, partial [Burkholderiaceae bacterium]
MTDSNARPTPPDTSLRAFLRLAWPIFIANLAIVGNGTVDTIMAGRLSPDDLAAVAIGLAAYISIYLGLVGVLQGLSPIAGHHYGARRYRQVGFELQQAMWLALLVLLVGAPLISATGLWLGLAKAEGHVAELATTYLHAVAFGLPAALGARAFIALNAAVSRPKVMMVISLSTLALKVPLNALFMYGLGPIPAFGGAGAGIATAILSWVALGLFWSVWRWDPFYQRLRAPRVHAPQAAALIKLLKLGVPIGLSTLFEVTSFTFMAIFIARLGADTVGGHQIVANLTALLFMIPLSLGIATSVLVAQSLGADNARQARNATLRGLRVSVVIAVFAAAGLWLFREPLIGLYTTNAAVAAVALGLIGYGAIFHVFDALQAIGGFALRGYHVT